MLKGLKGNYMNLAYSLVRYLELETSHVKLVKN